MKIGFDLDGVLCRIDIVVLHLMHKLPPEEESVAEHYYYAERTPTLNPRIFIHEDDEYYIITGRHQGLKEITEEWCRRFFPDAKGVYVVGGKPWYYYEAAGHRDPEAWAKFATGVAMAKVDKIKELGIDIYVDDSPSNVKKLREELPNVAILQYGGRT